MINRYSLIIIIVALIMIIGSFFPLIDIFTDDEMEGTLEPNWANPTGVQLKDVVPHSSIELNYNATEIVMIYLVTIDQAIEYRSPKWEKTPLPEPVHVSSEGDVRISFGNDTDYEILVLPEDGSFDFEFSYSVQGIEKDETSSYLSFSFFLSSAVIFLIVSITIQILHQKKGHE